MEIRNFRRGKEKASVYLLQKIEIKLTTLLLPENVRLIKDCVVLNIQNYKHD